MPNLRHYNVNFFELSKGALYEAKLMNCNPNYLTKKPCVYLVMTGFDPDIRFEKLKVSIRLKRCVRRYRFRLLSDLYDSLIHSAFTKSLNIKLRFLLIYAALGFGIGKLEK